MIVVLAVIHSGISGAVLTSSSAAPASSTTGLVLGLSNTPLAGIGWSKVHVRGWLGVSSWGLYCRTYPAVLALWGFTSCYQVHMWGCRHPPLRLWRWCGWRCSWRCGRGCGWGCCRRCCWRCCWWRQWRCQLVVIVQWQLAFLWWTCGGSSPSSRGSLGWALTLEGTLFCNMKVRVLPGQENSNLCVWNDWMLLRAN